MEIINIITKTITNIAKENCVGCINEIVSDVIHTCNEQWELQVYFYFDEAFKRLKDELEALDRNEVFSSLINDTKTSGLLQ